MNRQRLWILSVVLPLVCGCSFSEPTALEITQGHIGQAQWALALGSSNELIRANPNDHLGYLLHGRANLGLNNLEAAIEDLSRAIELAPKEPEAYYQRALAYEYLGQPMLATADRHAAHRRDPNFAITFAYTRVIFSEIGESAQDDDNRTPIPTSGTTALALKAEADDGELSSAMPALLGDDLDQAAPPAKKKNSLAATATKTVVPLDSQDDDLHDGPAVDGHRALKDVLVSPHDFFPQPHRRFRSENHLADSRKPRHPAGLAIDVPGTGNQSSAGMNRGKYPIVRWQAPGMSNVPGHSASRLGGSSHLSTGGKTQPGRSNSKFKPVVVAPHLLPPSGNTPSR